MTLYEIGQQYLEALEGMEIDPETGEIIGGEAVARLGGQFDEKCEAVGCYIKELNAQAAAIKAEQDGLQKRRKALETKAERLREYLADWMIAAGKDRLETPRAALSWRKTSAVVVDDLEALPACCRKVKIEPDKAMIRLLLKQGDPLEGARLEATRSLQIK